jgi:hypothetical protein
MVCERKKAGFRGASAMIPGGGWATIANSKIPGLKAFTEVVNDVRQWGCAAVVNDDHFELPRWKGLPGESIKTCAKTVRIIERGYNYGD